MIALFVMLLLAIWGLFVITNTHIDSRLDAIERRLFSGKTIEEEKESGE